MRSDPLCPVPLSFTPSTLSLSHTVSPQLFVLFRAPLSRLQSFAHLTKYRLELDPLTSRQFCEAGFPSSQIAPFFINSDPRYTPLDPYQHLYGRYATHLPPSIYKTSSISATDTPNPFKQSSRLKILYYLLQAPHRYGGLHLPLEKLMNKKKILAIYPLHDPLSLTLLKKSWLGAPLWSLPWKQPMNHLKEYFGEKIALYFAFMGVYTQALLLPAILGVGCQLVVWATGDWSREL
jgi:hypothetical protein